MIENKNFTEFFHCAFFNWVHENYRVDDFFCYGCTVGYMYVGGWPVPSVQTVR